MPIINGKIYRSKKHPMLEYIFFKIYKYDNSQKNITFTLGDISKGYRALSIREPASISNTILDLTRKKRHISTRLPGSIYKLGYDLRKKTGSTSNGESYAGEFVFVGVGNEIQSWLDWPTSITNTMTISSLGIPDGIREFLRNDEGALFSVIDYCDVFSNIFSLRPNSILRVQNPLKWQPNEIDGFYYGVINNHINLFPVEAKALTTGDDINLEQLQGALTVIVSKYFNRDMIIAPLAIKMIRSGILICEFKKVNTFHNSSPNIIPGKFHKVILSPSITSW